MIETISPPFCVKVSVTEGCNLRCSFCGISGIREPGPRGDRSGPYKHMTLRTAEAIAEQVVLAGWTPRLEFAGMGEPTLHPDLATIFSIFRGYLPRSQIMLTTNAVPLLDEPGFAARTDALFDAGLNIMALDDYRPHRVAPVAREYRRDGVRVVEYPDDPTGNPHQRRPPGYRMVSIMRDIAITAEGTHSKSILSNHCGAAAPRDPESSGRCANPFRDLMVRWNGRINLCCEDWRGEYRLGSVDESTLGDVWLGDEMMAIRRRLYAGLRDRGPCDGCTAVSRRVGLLPDKMGKSAMRPPDERDDETIARVLSVPSVAEEEGTLVLRKWESPVAWRGRSS